MKITWQKILFLATLAFSVSTLAASERLTNNCERFCAEVMIDATQARQFVATLATVSSMPLSGKIVSHHQGFAKVRVSIPVDYAVQNQLDAFDVAKRMLAFSPTFRITFVQAGMRLPWSDPFRAANVGTIGH